MGADFSRIRSNPFLDFAGVELQQGKVVLDADFNELVAVVDRRLRAAASDVLGRATVSSTTPDAFKIDATGGKISIGKGRLYVDGLLAENHGAVSTDDAKKLFDPLLAEPVYADDVDYAAQPYLPSPPPLPEAGRHLVYLDVWNREVTHLERPDLIEPAVGVETTSRVQTVWQVRALDSGAGNNSCSSPDKDFDGWPELIAPSTGRLTTGTFDVPPETDPCELPPTGGYRGLENQTYRIEIHNPGQPGGTATFKWSRENSSVGSRVASMVSAGELELQTLGRDDVLRFSTGDWVEIIDDVRELSQRCGEIRQITVAEAARRITFSGALPAEMIPATFPNSDFPRDRNLRVRRWDQKHEVLKAGTGGTTSVFQDLDAAGSTGVINVPAAGTTLLLENGVTVAFASTGAAGFKAGDYWVFAARTADASVELLDDAPPRGIHHHYARLAIVTFPDDETDCRTHWPPPTTAGEDCGCDRCVTVEGHNSGVDTLQKAVDDLAQTGGTICLAAGIYNLSEPLRITDAGSLRIKGKGWRTILICETPGPVIQIRNALGLVLENFSAAGVAAAVVLGNITLNTPGVIAAQNTVALELDGLYLLGLATGDAVSRTVSLSGYSMLTQMRRCAVLAQIGIEGGSGTPTTADQAGGAPNILLTAGFKVEDNVFLCNRNAVAFGRLTLHYGGTRIAENLILNPRLGAISSLGAALAGSNFEVDGNVIDVLGDGVVSAVNGLRVTGNEITGVSNNATGSGIVLAAGLDKRGGIDMLIAGNRVAQMSGAGVAVRARVGTALIHHNVFERVGRGIAFVDSGAADRVAIESNHFSDIAVGFNPTGETVVAIQVLSATRVDIVGNVVRDFAANALQAPDRAAIRIAASGTIRVAGNTLSDLAPAQSFTGYLAGIELVVPFTLANIADNTLLRTPAGDVAASDWEAIRVAPPTSAAGAAPRPMLLLDAIMIGNEQQVFLLSKTTVLTINIQSAQSVAIRGNQVVARASPGGLVLVAGALTTIFSENHCQAEPGATFAAAHAIVELVGGAIVVGNNRVFWTQNDADAIRLVGSKSFTVLGNITMGNIRIDGSPLPDPWKPLNVLAGL